jgi:nucleoid DNA-binding protein
MYDSETLFNMGKYRVRFSGKHEAIYDYDTGKHYTYSEMDKRSDKLAWFLTEKLGLKKGDRVTLVGFGTFGVSQRKARNGRNPQTGAVIKIAARKVARFTPGLELKKAVNKK